ncbi:MAG: trigger factor [Candidatus Staskawiczbacteria bacterium]|nr:trigger factor [Candidatus Staskawiczbacteria bacterium]
MKTNLKKLVKSQMEIEFELTAEEFGKHIDGALLHFKEHVKMDGFRQGHVPKEMVREKIGQENLLMEAGDMAVKESYLKFIQKNNLEPIGEPEVQILKIAEGNSLLFKVTITVLPEIILPDYKKIASNITIQLSEKEISVSDTEVENALNYLQKSRAKLSQKDKEAEVKDFVEIIYWSEHINAGKEINPVRNKSPEVADNPQLDWISNGIKDRFILGEGGFMKGFEDNIIGMSAGQEKEFLLKFSESVPQKDLAGKEVVFKVKMVSVQKMEFPEINDEFAKNIGDFDSLIGLKNNIKEGIISEKKESEKQKRRNQFLEKITEKIDFNIPEKLIEAESARLLEDLKNNISSKFKISFEEYLASIKQTEEEIKKTFVKEAEKRIKNFLVLKEVGKKENIEISEKELEEEINKAIKNYSKEQIAKIDTKQFKEYTKDVIFNEKVFQKLESFTK